jgi:hypothetical protein
MAVGKESIGLVWFNFYLHSSIRFDGMGLYTLVIVYPESGPRISAPAVLSHSSGGLFIADVHSGVFHVQEQIQGFYGMPIPPQVRC